jgi:hypothetical protein
MYNNLQEIYFVGSPVSILPTVDRYVRSDKLCRICYSVSSLKQQSVGRSVTPFEHTIQISTLLCSLFLMQCA